jgi:hypothetical protein
MNTSFSNSGYDSNSNFYNSDWSNQSDFTWSTQAIGNYAHQFDEVHHSDYLQFDHQAQPSAYQAPQPAPQSSLEEMMKAFMQSTNKFVQATDRNIQELKNSNQELKNATMANSREIQELKSSIARIEGQISHLVIELNRIEEEELQSQLIIEKHYMSDEDKSEIFYHEHVQVTTTLDEDEVVDNEEEQVEHNERIEHHEKSQPPTNLNLPSDMEASTEAPACITAPLETHQDISSTSPRTILCQDTQGSMHTSAKI